MTNEQIIMQEKALNGIDEPVHTYQVWKKMGFKVNKGEHACIKTSLWRMSNKSKKDDEEEREHFYLAKANLFASSQVSRIEENDGTDIQADK